MAVSGFLKQTWYNSRHFRSARDEVADLTDFVDNCLQGECLAVAAGLALPGGCGAAWPVAIVHHQARCAQQLQKWKCG
jgi:hypothetical protein